MGAANPLVERQRKPLRRAASSEDRLPYRLTRVNPSALQSSLPTP